MADNNNNKILNVPPLRFPKFTDEWEKQKLSDFVERVTRKNKNNESKLPLTISAQYGLVDQITFFNKVIASNDISGYYLLKKGEFAYNKSYSGDYTWGAVKRLDRYEQGALSTLYICFSPLECVISDYLVHYFETKKWHREVSEIAVEGARNHGLLNIGVADYFNTKHFLPSKKEQKKIAAFLNLIEKRIALQTKIIEKYKSLIKGIGKMLMNGEPNVRLSECLKSHSSTLQENQVAEVGMYEVFGANGKCGYVDRPLIDGETILIVKDGSGVGNVMYRTGKYSVIGTLNYLTTNKSYCLKYLYFLLLNFNFEPYKTGMAIPHIYFKDYGKATVYCPSLEEQIDISTKLDALESKIETEQSFLNLLCLQKQYLLQQMFI